MPMIHTPGGAPFRMNENTMDLASKRIAARFGFAGLAAPDDRHITSRVLPMVRGRNGWFYLSDGMRSQLRPGMSRPVFSEPWTPLGMGDVATDAANYTAMAASVPQGSYLQKVILDCASNPTPNCANAAATSWFISPTPTAASAAAANAAAAAGQPIPELQFFSGPPPGTYIPTTVTPQEAASAATGKANQSVPPTDTSTPMPTGTGASGGNPVLNSGTATAPPPSSSGTAILIGIGVLAFLFLKGR